MLQDMEKDPMAKAPAAAIQAAATDYGPSIQSAPLRAAAANKWDLSDKVFRFFFMQTPASLVERVIGRAREWTKYINVKFDVVQNASQANARVRCSRLLGHSSHVGIDAARETDLSKPTMTLGFSDLVDFRAQEKHNDFVVLHEVGHALGFIHEHNRRDAPHDFKTAETIAYFARRGLNAAQVQSNIFDRWNRDLIRQSAYDTKSIMHYMFPDEIMVSGHGVPQNYELSQDDVQIARDLYGKRDGEPLPDGKDGQKGSVATPITLTIDGEPGKTTVKPNQPTVGKLKVSAAQAGLCTIYSVGSTQVVLQLLGPNDATKDATPTEVSGHGTYDLTNDVILATLAEGDFVVKVQHVSPRGGGPTIIVVKSGDQVKGHLLQSNALLP
jgi:hypothetical protein